ncbi:MAG: aa3-type cytochrome c oxidase subunit III CoxC [Bacteroidetes bacterium HLUCCA01]|nr:MAG: aa3-type cytochrome c oxidase subunit III CoxC [Bacteroidetes bacterium HLUCCA01]
MANINATPGESHLAHHFVDSEQQFDSSKLGMWIFLVTEVLFFGGLFVAYIVYRSWNPELFYMSAKELSTIMGAINTVVLIGSSLTIALAVRAAQLNQQANISRYLIATILLACVFLVIKYFEYTSKFAVGILPGELYTYTGIDHPGAPIFFSIYYMMTGLHGIHVIIGIGLMVYLLVKTRQGSYNAAYFTPVEITALYWHLVDLIWIFLFPLLYLIE